MSRIQKISEETETSVHGKCNNALQSVMMDKLHSFQKSREKYVALEAARSIIKSLSHDENLAASHSNIIDFSKVQPFLTMNQALNDKFQKITKELNSEIHEIQAGNDLCVHRS